MSKQNPGKPAAKPVKKRQAHKAKAQRVILSISEGLLDIVDEAAKQDFTTRSDIIRTALLWYLRPQGCDLNQTDPEAIFKTLKLRRDKMAMRKLTANL